MVTFLSAAKNTQHKENLSNSLLLFGDPPFNCVLYASIAK
jgi:hypothetical protein